MRQLLYHAAVIRRGARDGRLSLVFERCSLEEVRHADSRAGGVLPLPISEG